ncbi:MAG: TonB-dependent receptor [Desulfobacteraceae bacterium]|nr:TonB-dependent receptor [Desulfobacteraceae bacterium]MBC2755469.1 TonB-dependent receptor [Desulfobacteraceae bacterium]
MKKRLTLPAIFILFLILATNSIAGDEGNKVYSLETITVQDQLILPTKQTGDSLYTGTSVTKKGLELIGTPAETSIYNAISILPGTNVESLDPYGLSHSYMRVRGLKDRYIGMTVEGVPNYGIMPIGAREDIYDTQNVKSVSLYKGASPADLGTGSGNRGGAIELELRRPEDKVGAEISQGLGSDNFMRTFLRVDSGKLPTETKFFASYSYSKADKWKGEGELGPRDHVTLGLSQEFGDKVNCDIFFNFNEIEKHSFQSLTYEEAKDIDNYYDKSFIPALTSDSNKNKDYYDYNREKFINRDLMSIIDIAISENTNLSLKPYYSSEDASTKGKAQFMMGSEKTPGIVDKIKDLERYGIIPELGLDFSAYKITAGYWFESHNLEKYMKKYFTTDDDGLDYKGYGYYAKNDGNGAIHSPYAKISGGLDRFKFQAGLKYFYYEEPASTGYKPDLSAEDPDISLKAVDYDEFLPTAGIGWEFNKNSEAYFNYGRNYMRPYAYVPVTTNYVKYRSAFKSANMTLQDILDKWEMETSDNYDISFRYHSKNFSIAPVAFYSKHHDLLVSVDDQNVINNGKPVSYHQNVGDATSYGFELETSFCPSKNLFVYFNPSYTDMSFDDNFETKGSVLKIKGNQLPDTPKWVIKSGLIYTISDFEISPMVRWVDKRYGDAANKEEVDDYIIVDLGIKYSKEDLWWLRHASIGLELKNLFDEKYVGAIYASDTATSVDYYAGSPFTVIFSIGGKF